jgi:putative DNA primase/helicase
MPCCSSACDHVGPADSRSIGNIVYMLINGTGKARATRNAEARIQQSWRTMVLSSGEVGLADKIQEGGKGARAGQLVRVVDVPADAGKGLGAFEDTKGVEPAEFAELLKNAALRMYGTAGPLFVEGLARMREEVEATAPAHIRAITQKLLQGIPDPDGQARRVAARFALVAVAGEWALKLLNLPWREGEAEHAATIGFQAWRATRGATDQAS